jgi:hypothetical protein
MTFSKLDDFWWLAVLCAACGANATIEVLWFRIFRAGGLFRAMLAGFLGGLAALAVASWAFGDRSVWGALCNAGTYICFSYVLFHWNNMGETGRRVRLAIELQNAPNGLTRNEILARYGHREIVDRRIARLLASRQIIETNSRYHVANTSVLTMARIIGVLKLLLKVE